MCVHSSGTVRPFVGRGADRSFRARMRPPPACAPPNGLIRCVYSPCLSSLFCSRPAFRHSPRAVLASPRRRRRLHPTSRRRPTARTARLARRPRTARAGSVKVWGVRGSPASARRAAAFAAKTYGRTAAATVQPSEARATARVAVFCIAARASRRSLSCVRYRLRPRS